MLASFGPVVFHLLDGLSYLEEGHVASRGTEGKGSLDGIFEPMGEEVFGVVEDQGGSAGAVQLFKLVSIVVDVVCEQVVMRRRYYFWVWF